MKAGQISFLQRTVDQTEIVPKWMDKPSGMQNVILKLNGQKQGGP